LSRNTNLKSNTNPNPNPMPNPNHNPNADSIKCVLYSQNECHDERFWLECSLLAGMGNAL